MDDLPLRLYVVQFCGNGNISFSVTNLTELMSTRVKLGLLSRQELIDLLESRSRRAG